MTKVFYTVPRSGKPDYQAIYDTVLKSIQKNPVEVISPELGNYKKLLTKKDLNNKYKDHYDAIKKGITWADLVILEVSFESYHLGHELTLALQSKTPVLSLSLHKDWSKRIVSPYHFGSKYSKFFIDEIIKDFLEKNSKEKLSERFNLFLTKRQLKKLEKLSTEKGMNMSEYLRSLI